MLDMENASPLDNVRLQFYSLRGSSEEMFEIRLGAPIVGSAQVRYLDRLTDGYTRDTVYLTWIGVDETHRNQGIGTEFLDLMVHFLSAKGYRYLHTDTARGNIRAQHFYVKLGFQSGGFTRSYIQI
jgi:ribosomal protein S18 acetylase RimI-like enzyme